MDDVKCLFIWLKDNVDKKEVDATLEWLGDNNMLNTKGKKFAHELWEKVWKEDALSEKKVKGCGKKFKEYNFLGDDGKNIKKREKCGDITILDNKTLLLCDECSQITEKKSEEKCKK